MAKLRASGAVGDTFTNHSLLDMGYVKFFVGVYFEKIFDPRFQIRRVEEGIDTTSIAPVLLLRFEKCEVNKPVCRNDQSP